MHLDTVTDRLAILCELNPNSNIRNVFEVGRSVDPQTAGVWAFHCRVKLPAIHPEVSVRTHIYLSMCTHQE